MQRIFNIKGKCRKSIPVFIFVMIIGGFLIPSGVCSRSKDPDPISALWIKYRQAADDSTKVMLLSKLAYVNNLFFEEPNQFDSLSDEAIRLAERSRHPGLIIFACNNYLESSFIDNYVHYEKAMDYGRKALQQCKQSNNRILEWRTNRNLAQVFLSQYEFNKALSAGNEAMRIANALGNNSMIAESYLVIGSSKEGKMDKTNAIKLYLTAIEKASEFLDTALLIKCYSKLSSFYLDAMLFDEAIDFKKKEGNLIRALNPVDSVALMWTLFDLQVIDVRQKKLLDENNVKNILDYAIRTGNQRLKSGEFAIYRTILLETDNLIILYNFYTLSYPDEFGKLLQSDPEMYYRIKAYFKELENQSDSAHYYFRKAEQLVIDSPVKATIYWANFYNRYGEFLIRHGQPKEAIEKFVKALKSIEAQGYPGKFEFMLTASRHLESIYAKLGDYKKAWYYATLTLQISDSINAITKKDQVMAESFKQERSLKDAATALDKEKIRQGRNERNMLAGIVVFFIIVSLLVFRNYRIQKRLNGLLDKEKKKSDDLLLNILPYDTAEELKLKGKAIAKRYDQVTVMFTDFRNFTQASELMSAEELVHEINYYYTEFDNIISRHNIEKIKIIGDSYMCAGGLPVANQTHAHDVVQAAVELQEFMLSLRNERMTQGRSSFELRIGIHTGPVVAGIVGLKKFAYDIWGDTVNTASRMENTGEPNKINISGETYHKVKDRFTCSYRGKVPAKHKGEIDMYFVETSF